MVNASLPVGRLYAVLAILGAVGLWCSYGIVTGNMTRKSYCKSGIFHENFYFRE